MIFGCIQDSNRTSWSGQFDGKLLKVGCLVFEVVSLFHEAHGIKSERAFVESQYYGACGSVRGGVTGVVVGSGSSLFRERSSGMLSLVVCCDVGNGLGEVGTIDGGDEVGGGTLTAVGKHLM